MTTEEFKNLFQNEIMPAIGDMRDAGQEEYAHDIDEIFANFNRIANSLDCDRKKVLMTYLLKHIDGINAYVKGHVYQREDVTGRITDCIVYLMLLWGMIKEERTEWYQVKEYHEGYVCLADNIGNIFEVKDKDIEVPPLGKQYD